MDAKKIILMLIVLAAIISITAVSVAAADIISSDISIEDEFVSDDGLSRYSISEDNSIIMSDQGSGKKIPVAVGTITLNISSDSDAYLKKLENALNGDVNATMLLELNDTKTGKTHTFTQENLSSVTMQGDEIIVEIHAEQPNPAGGDIYNPEIKFLRIDLGGDVDIVANPSK